jgi:hypothetical protein
MNNLPIFEWLVKLNSGTKRSNNRLNIYNTSLKKFAINYKIHTLILIHIHKNMAAALRTSHITPNPNNVSPVTPENRSPRRTKNAVKIQATRIRL